MAESGKNDDRSSSDGVYPRPRSKRVQAYERRMQAVDPDYRLPLVDFWDPSLADQLADIHRDRRGWIRGSMGDLLLRYRRSRLRGVRVDLEILDRRTGRRLRQDASASEDLYERLTAICSAFRRVQEDHRSR